MITAERGDLTVEHEEKKQDEIGMLGRSFNKMIVRIRGLLDLYERQERKKREAELRALQEHIKPHFLYNTLDTIQWMARKENSSDIAEMVESLSRLFRIGLSNGRELISVEDEIAHIRSYLTIQQIRYRDKLSYSITSPEAIQRYRVLKLIIQPIVENAIYHGIKERRGMGHVHIEVLDDADSILIRIEDDGKGMDEATLEQVRAKLAQRFEAQDALESESQQGGYGMLNVQARMKLTFGEAYGISIESTLGQGTVVSIRHPRLEQ
jgi:two-component system sensor histidine kinase YesM